MLKDADDPAGSANDEGFVIRPHPETDGMTTAEIRAAIGKAEEKMLLARALKNDELEVWHSQEIRLLEAALARRNGNAAPPASLEPDPISEALQGAGIADLNKKSTMANVEESVRNLALWLEDADDVRRATVRESAIKKLTAIGVSAPVKLIDAAMPPVSAQSSPLGAGEQVFLRPVEPWPKQVDGAETLDQIVYFVRRFVVMPPAAADAVALWVAHAHALAAAVISPILAVTSPTKRAGKTTLLEILAQVAPKALATANITAAALFRVVQKFSPTLLIDEAETFFRDNEELRGILNASHRRASAFVVRTVGDDHEPALFKTWCPKAIALIGRLPGTLEDRAIPVDLRRRAPGENREVWRSETCTEATRELARKLARWTADNLESLRSADPELPASLHDRAADNWRPLAAIADAAGGSWGKRVRGAAVALSESVDETEESAAILILRDIKALFQGEKADRLTSISIIEKLGGMEDRPWPEWRRGKPITQRQLARLLAAFRITPRNIRTDLGVAKGYFLPQFLDLFARYLPPRTATALQTLHDADLERFSEPLQKTDVAAKNPGNSSETKQCSAVADENGGEGGFKVDDPWDGAGGA